MVQEATTLEFQKDEFVTDAGSVRVAGPLEETLAVQIVRMGFETDPIARWVYPDPITYLNVFPEFIRAFAGKAFGCDTAYIGKGNAGAALWMPPGVEADEEALVRIYETTSSVSIRRDLFSVLDQMEKFHPDEPHWFLPMIAVEPYRQREGIGTSLMAYALERCDEEQVLAYLVSTNPRNITLYHRFGFEVIGVIRSGGSPPMFPMLRKPRPYAY